MKFNNGFWLIKDGYTMNYPMQAYRIDVSGNKVGILAPCKYVAGKGDTMNHPALTVELSSPLKDIIRVRVRHFTGGADKRGFDIACGDGAGVRIDQDAGELRFTSGDLSARVKKDPWRLDFYYRGRRLTGGGQRHTAYVTSDGGGVYMRAQFDLDVGECVYGLGERFTELVKNGQTVDVWNEDGGTCSEQAYKSVPFYVTSGGYGVFVNHTGKVSFEVGSEVVSRVGVSVEGEELDYFIIGGDSMKDVIGNYTALTGRPALPPAWSFGLWLSTSFTTDYDEKTVSEFINGMSKRDIPLSVFHFDCYWMKEFNLCDFEWDERVFKDPKGMLSRLKEKGLHISVWLNPYVGQNTRMFREGREKGYFIRRQDGCVWQWDMWEPGLAIVDFTNPEAAKWFASKLEKLLETGVDCFKTDFGERIPVEGVKYYDGSDPSEMHNYYTYIYNKTVFDTLRAHRRDAVLFARSATAGSQKFPVHWGGDCTAEYASMAETLRGGLSLGMGGFGFWSHDIGGFENTATPDLYKRWVAFGLLSSHSRLHGSSSYRVPWLFDEESVDVVRLFTKLKCTLMPYIYSKAVEASQSGLPVMRAMALEFEGDPVCRHLDRQFMLGDSLLVAPIFNDRSEAEYYLPKGRWYDYFGKKAVEGGRYYGGKCDYLRVPLFIRENSIVAVGSRDDRPDYDYADNVNFIVGPLSENAKAAADVFGADGKKLLCAQAVLNGGTVEIEVDSDKPWTAFLTGVACVKGIKGAKAEFLEGGALIKPERGVKRAEVKL